MTLETTTWLRCVWILIPFISLTVTESAAVTCTTFSIDAGRDVYRARLYEGPLELAATVINPDPSDPVVSYAWVGTTINETSTSPTVTVPAGSPSIALDETVTLTATAQSGCTVSDTIRVRLFSDGELENFLLQLRGQSEYDMLMDWKSSTDSNEVGLYFQALRTIEEFLVASTENPNPGKLSTIGSLNLPHGTNGDFAWTTQGGFTYYFMAGGESARWFRVLRAPAGNPNVPPVLLKDDGFGRKQYAFGIAYRQSGVYAYVVGSDGLDVIDVSDPENALHVGRWQPSSTTVPGQRARPYLTSVTIHPTDPNLIYASAQALSAEDPNNLDAIDGVYVIDVSNAALPASLGRLPYTSTCAPAQYLGGSWGGLRHRGSDLVFIESGANDSLFVANGRSGLDQLVLSADGRTLAGSAAYQTGCPASGTADRLLAHGTSLWVGGTAPVISRYDSATPPSGYSSVPVSPAPSSFVAITSLATDGTFLFAGGYGQQAGTTRPSLVETRAMDPYAFTLVSTMPLPQQKWTSFPATLAYAGGRLLVEDDWHIGATYSYRAKNSGLLQGPTGTLHLSGEARPLAVAGVNAYAGTGSFVAVVDISAPSAPSLRSWLDLGGFGAADLQSGGSYIYVLQPVTGKLLIIDATEPLAPFVRTNSVSTPVGNQGLKSMCVSGTTLLVHWHNGSGTGTLAVYDISGANGAAPVLVRQIGLNLDPNTTMVVPTASFWTMTCDDQYAYVRGSQPPASSPPLLKIFAVNYQTPPYAQHFASFDLAQDAIQTTIAKQGQYLLVHNGLVKNLSPGDLYRRKASGIVRVDVSNPASMVLAGHVPSYSWSASGIMGIPGTNKAMTSAYSMDRGVRIFDFVGNDPTLTHYEDADMLHTVDDAYSALGWNPGVAVGSMLYSLKLDHLEVFNLP